LTQPLNSAVSNAASLALCFLQALSAASFAPKYQAEAKARAAQRRCTGLQLRFQRAVTALHRVQLRNDFDEAGLLIDHTLHEGARCQEQAARIDVRDTIVFHGVLGRAVCIYLVT
jgi:hypothetical protein